jgi:hypothetical protein
MKAAREKGAAEAIPFFKRAIELDPNFALAYVGLGVSYGPNLLEPGLAAENIRKAYQLRGRVSEREKLNITAAYYGGVTGELEKAIQVTELWARTYPRDPAAHTGLGCLGRLVGKPDPAKVTFGEVLNHYLAYGKKKTGEDKAHSSKNTDERNARLHLSHWAEYVAKDIEPLEIQEWIDGLSKGLRSKLRNTMSAVYSHGQKFRMIPPTEESNPMRWVSATTVSDYEAVSLSPEESFAFGTDQRSFGTCAGHRCSDYRHSYRGGSGTHVVGYRLEETEDQHPTRFCRWRTGAPDV